MTDPVKVLTSEAIGLFYGSISYAGVHRRDWVCVLGVNLAFAGLLAAARAIQVQG